MAQYAIKELEHLSGIKAHTIRIWEQRYNLLTPQRTGTNIRFYSDADLKTILNVSLLHEKGYKISKIAKMSARELTETVMSLSVQADNHFQIDALLMAMIELDEEKFEKALRTPILQHGFEKAMLEVVYPFLSKIGILWQTGNINPGHEHFISNLIRQKIIVAIDGQTQPFKEKAKRVLLFLPEGEFHEIALLFISYVARARNFHVMYLGQSLPFADLQEAVASYKPGHLISVFTSAPERDQVQHYIDQLSEAFPGINLLLYGALLQAEDLTFPDKAEKLTCITHLIERLDKL